MHRPLVVMLLLLPLAAAADASARRAKAAATKAAAREAPAPQRWMKAAREGQTLYATLRTSMGDIVIRLFPKDAPKAVENFVGLATGEKPWRHPLTGEVRREPLYDGVVFHRVIPGFMIQGGDPLGQGFGGPGYTFEDEFQSGRRFTRPGLVAMANAGPDTNGSQFFITVSERPLSHLDNRHTIFGEVIWGYETAVRISEVPRDVRKGDRPDTPVVIHRIEISDKVEMPADNPPGRSEKKAETTD